MSQPMRRCHRPPEVWTCDGYREQVTAFTAEVERLTRERNSYYAEAGRLSARVTALTAEVERLRAQEGWQRALFDQAVAQCDEAVALLREAPVSDDRRTFRAWRQRRNALLAAVAPQEAARETRWPYRDALSEAHQRQRKGLPCWCGQVSGHVGWLVCAHERASESTAPVEAQEVGAYATDVYDEPGPLPDTTDTAPVHDPATNNQEG